MEISKVYAKKNNFINHACPIFYKIETENSAETTFLIHGKNRIIEPIGYSTEIPDYEEVTNEAVITELITKHNDMLLSLINNETIASRKVELIHYLISKYTRKD